ncbi:MAG: electron transfer flavoprotein subunit beta/FixA family protein [Synergistetes bacterium]|nr:electron transfer flavoprotein subunit beta/FixA family protein [Synergistota bacterium]MCX8127706.1 electron transfer flavoprotein subunit beta/FixA family protein [Synergistota bacterium]MDW8191379.1 electron transfer flavoprotein subunit beta/FixA family protein [Synergistota bacterium]
MKICVLVKQVPATDKVKMDEKTGTMIRTEMEAELNPLDMYAVEEAVRVKERMGGDAKITVISMGPLMAADAIKDAISMGCDEGYLISDKLLAGSDTWATAYTLSEAIKYLGGFDLIFCGERATDGETGQVGPSVASFLGIPALTYVSKIEKLERGYIRVWRVVEGGYEVVETDLPALLSVVKEINEPRLPNLSGKLRAKEIQIPILTVEKLNLDRKLIGLEGSPTRVVKIFYPKLSRGGKIISGKDPYKAVSELIVFLESKGIL